MIKFCEELSRRVNRKRTMSGLKDILLESISSLPGNISNGGSKGLQYSSPKELLVYILTAPCYGFGDVVFSLKLGLLLQRWYGCTVVYVTTTPESYKKLGVDSGRVVRLRSKSENRDCRRFGSLHVRNLRKGDLIFVAPVPTQYTCELSDVRRLLSWANSFNTYFFTEYNHPTEEGADFCMGVGKNKCGIFLEKGLVSATPVSGLGKNFAFGYIANNSPGYNRCVFSFLEMLIKKYGKKYSDLEVVLPGWFEYIYKKFMVGMKPDIKKNLDRIELVTDGKVRISVYDGGRGDMRLTIRCDILPVSYEKMLWLMENSIEDILVTGDQSISDVLACCCKRKNVWYQIASWKEGFGESLMVEMPQKYYRSSKTSCGTVKGIGYKSAYGNFCKKWSFRERCKKKLDSVIGFVMMYKSVKLFRSFVDDVMSMRSINGVKKSLRIMCDKMS